MTEVAVQAQPTWLGKRSNDDNSSPAAASGTTVLGWGTVGAGELGDGTDDQTYTTPQTLSMPPGKTITAVAAGSSLGIAIADGKVYAWGHGSGAGDGLVPTPSLVTALQDYTALAIASSDTHSLALTSHGLFSWGANNYGELGTGGPGGFGYHPPAKVDFSKIDPADRTITAIAAGGTHSLALTSTNKILAWGQSVGETPDSPVPIYVTLALDPPPSGDFVAISAAWAYSIVATSTGQVVDWGMRQGTPNDDGHAGYVDFSQVDPPLPPGTTFTALACGGSTRYALTSTGKVLAWGFNYQGQLGNGGTDDSTVPVYVEFSKAVPAPPDSDEITAIAASNATALAVTSTGQLLAWGSNQGGMLGTGQAADQHIHSSVPVYPKVDPKTTVPGVAAGGFRVLALGSGGPQPILGGIEFAWGRDDHGQLGNGYKGESYDSSKPEAMSQSGLPADTKFTSTAAGWNHSLAVTTDGDVYATGYNDAGQLGDNDPNDVDSLSLQKVVDLDLPIKAVSGGEHHSLALSQDGSTVFAWGANGSGQLGTTNNKPSKTPVGVKLPGDTYIAVAAGEYHSLALTEDGKVYSWGNNYYGSLGVGTHGDGKNSNKPLHVTGALSSKKVIAIAAGAQHSVAITDDHEAYSWGYNKFAQLGDGSNGPGTDSDVPVRVKGLPEVPLKAVGAGQMHSVVCTQSGEVWAWGNNKLGQLGNEDGGPGKFSKVAVPTKGLDGVTITNVSCGTLHSLAIASSTGKVYSWGGNGYGQLGLDSDSKFEDSAREIDQGDATFKAVGGGQFHSVAC